MITRRGIKIKQLFQWSGHHMVWLLGWAAIVAGLYDLNIVAVELPWVPASIIGTAVAFYVGFKNNSAYDRLWEARKIWGGIINSSRAWGMYVDGFVTNLFADPKRSEDEIYSIKKRLIYRHIAWLYALRSQLLVSAPWEHINQNFMYRFAAKRYQKYFGVGLVADEVTRIELKNYLPADDYDRLINNVNTATQIINEQSRDLTKLRSSGLIEDFRHMEMANLLYDFYDYQGKNERIKKYPLPRQYANLSRIFIGIFIMILPFTLIPMLLHLGTWGYTISIVVTALIGWIYIMMEIVGDYSENPFEGMANDIPMLSICRTIEIDLKEMLGEKELPPPIESKNGILM
jgi:putative membrane protein